MDMQRSLYVCRRRAAGMGGRLDSLRESGRADGRWAAQWGAGPRWAWGEEPLMSKGFFFPPSRRVDSCPGESPSSSGVDGVYSYEAAIRCLS